jgi:hypothetical protein
MPASSTPRRVTADPSPAFMEPFSPIWPSKDRVSSPDRQSFQLQPNTSPPCYPQSDSRSSQEATGGPSTSVQQSHPSSRLPPPGSVVSVASVTLLQPDTSSVLPSQLHTPSPTAVSPEALQPDTSSALPSPLQTSSTGTAQKHEQPSALDASLPDSCTIERNDHLVPGHSQAVHLPSSAPMLVRLGDPHALSSASGSLPNCSTHSTCHVNGIEVVAGSTRTSGCPVDGLKSICKHLQCPDVTSREKPSSTIDGEADSLQPDSNNQSSASSSLHRHSLKGASALGGVTAAPVPRIAQPLLRTGSVGRLQVHRESDVTACSSSDIPAAWSGGQVPGQTSSSESTATARNTNTGIPARPSVSGYPYKGNASRGCLSRASPLTSPRMNKESMSTTASTSKDLPPQVFLSAPLAPSINPTPKPSGHPKYSPPPSEGSPSSPAPPSHMLKAPPPSPCTFKATASPPAAAARASFAAKTVPTAIGKTALSLKSGKQCMSCQTSFMSDRTYSNVTSTTSGIPSTARACSPCLPCVYRMLHLFGVNK